MSLCESLAFAFDDAQIEIDNAELMLFPDVQLGTAPYSLVIKSSDEVLMPGTISFSDDASIGDNKTFTALANTVSLGGGDVVYKVGSELSINLSQESFAG